MCKEHLTSDTQILCVFVMLCFITLQKLFSGFFFFLIVFDQ